jgi:hypothetical protein
MTTHRALDQRSIKFFLFIKKAFMKKKQSRFYFCLFQKINTKLVIA